MQLIETDVLGIVAKQREPAQKSKHNIQKSRKRDSVGNIAAKRRKTMLKSNYIQATSVTDESESEADEGQLNILVNVDVHAEMNASISNVHEIDTPTVSPSQKVVFSKRLMLETLEQKRIHDDIFAIEDGVEWQTVSKNLNRYRIKSEKKRPKASHSSVCVVRT